jgi:hypothetical protein
MFVSRLRAGTIMALAAIGFCALFATQALANPTRTTACDGCHSGPVVPVMATLVSMSGTTAKYSVSAPSANGIAVFDGSTKLFTFTASPGSFSVAAGKTYNIYAVVGPTTSSGVGSITVSPVVRVLDTTPPVTTSDAQPTYTSTAAILLSATDAGSGVARTYYRIDGSAQVIGTSVVVNAIGSHTIQFWSVDVAGNTEAPKTATFTITAPDITPPVTLSNAKSTYVSSAAIILAAADASSGVAATYYKIDGGAQTAGTSILVSTLGTHTVEFWSVDVAGNTEAHKTATFSVTAPIPVDTTPPATASDAQANYVSSATIKFTATDTGSGVATTYYKIDGGAQTAGTTVCVSTLGTHVVEFWSVDVAGNVEAHKTATFSVTAPDTTAPVTTSDTQASYVSAAAINLTATDAGSGVAITYYRLDGGAQMAGTSIATSVIGSHAIQFWSVDVAGNAEAPKTATFTITAPDVTPPTTVSNAKVTYVASAAIILSATDASSGVAATYYKIDGGAQAAGTSVLVSTLGTHTVEFWSVDVAGNAEAHKTATFSVTAPVPVDTTAPVTKCDAQASYVASATIKFTATDTGSGVATTCFKIDGGTQVTGSSALVSTPGTHTVEFWSVDAAGNAEAHKTAIFSVATPNASSTTLTISSSSHHWWFNVKLFGTLDPNGGRKSVAIYVMKPHSTVWVLAARTTTDRRGSWSYHYHRWHRGTYLFQARFAGSGDLKPAVSATITVGVR